MQCGESSTSNANKALQEIYRVLTSKGVYILVSYGAPEVRKTFLQKVVEGRNISTVHIRPLTHSI